MKKHSIEYLLKTITVLTISTIILSCSGIYDTLKEYATEETIYPANYETVSGKVGFERVELDFSTQGRIPASEMKLAKAKRTVIECSVFEKPLVIDSICSWVNITNLTEPEEYTFKVYTEDEYGNQSIPKEISLTPFTSRDLEEINLLYPKVIESRSTVLLEWENNLSGVFFNCYSYSYKYTDKYGAVQKGEDNGDIPSFFVENIDQGEVVPVELTLYITPKKNNSLILDTIYWSSTLPIQVSEQAGDVIFLKTPSPAYIIDFNVEDESQFCNFSWTKVDNVSAYTLKMSTNPNFPEDNTFTLNMADVSSVDIPNRQFKELVSEGSVRYYWTITPSTADPTINTQTRAINIFRKYIPVGLWLFDDPSDLFKASIGQPLIEVSSGDKIYSDEGPSPDSKAIFVPEYSYLTCNHGITPKSGDKYVNEYTILMNMKLSSFKWFSIVDINDTNGNGDLFISSTGEVGITGYWGTAASKMALNRWHRIAYSVKLDEYMQIYMDGKMVSKIGAHSNWKDGNDFALRPKLYLLKDDNSWNDRNNCWLSEVIIWDISLNEMEMENLINIKF